MSDEASTVLNTIVGALLGFGAAVFSEPLRQWLYRPKLKLEFTDDSGCKARTLEEAMLPTTPLQTHSVHEAEYIRIKATNTKPAIAKNCRAYLVAIEKVDEDGQFKPTIYCDSIPLAWSCRANSSYNSIELPRGVVQYIDVISTRSISEDFKLEIEPVPLRYISLFEEHGRFRFTIQVSGENVEPSFIKIVFSWFGVWNDYEVELG